MSAYVALIYDDEAYWEAMTPEQEKALHDGHAAFQRAHRDAVRGTNALHLTTTATSVRRDATGALVVTDGPFVETKEALGGYYVLDAPDLDAAVDLARQLPERVVEVRPVQLFA